MPIDNSIPESLPSLYQLMDTAWKKIADSYQFQCNGCEDNCCRSLFFHHTHIEKAYLLYGFDQLDQKKKKAALERAEDYFQKIFPADGEIKSLKIMCPLNENEKCIVYPYRPMICRLHGLPHEIRNPGSNPLMGKGCESGRFNKKAYIPFDRTPFYQNMVQIESDYRITSKRNGKIKETIAQMLLSE